jgi:hypothetical protein
LASVRPGAAACAGSWSVFGKIVRNFAAENASSNVALLNGLRRKRDFVLRVTKPATSEGYGLHSPPAPETAVTMMKRRPPDVSKEAKSGSRFPLGPFERNSPSPPREFARSFHAFEQASSGGRNGKLYRRPSHLQLEAGSRPVPAGTRSVFSNVFKGDAIHLLFTKILRRRLKCRTIRCRSCRRGLEDGGRVRVSAQGRFIAALKGASDGLCPHRG